MTKKKAKGGHAAAVSPAVDGPAKTPSGAADAELDLSAILPQFALALRAVLPPSSYIPSNILQSFAVAYCIFVLPGRPTSLLHPEAILENLIQDAPSTLKIIIGGLIVVQLYFGGQAKRWWDASQNAGKAASVEKVPEEGTSRQRQTVSNANEALLAKLDPLIETLVTTALFAGGLFVLLILFGAPVSRKVTETALLAAFLSLLAFTPPIYALTAPLSAPPVPVSKTMVRYTWVRLFSLFEPKTDLEIALVLPAYGTLIGCFLGAIPEGLDWEMPWQTWPVPCILGAFLGWSAGQMCSLGVCGLVWLSQGKGSGRIVRLQRAIGAASTSTDVSLDSKKQQ